MSNYLAAAAAAAAAEAAARDAADAEMQRSDFSTSAVAMAGGDEMMTEEEQMVHQYMQHQQQQQELEQQQQPQHPQFAGGGHQDQYDHSLMDGMDHEMAVNGGDPESIHFLQQMMAQQRMEKEERELQMRLEAAAAAEAALLARPQEHFITVAKNGEILGVTETVTGFPPNNLLMTSVYDSIHDDDLLGVRAVQAHFWERGSPSVRIYLRRRAVEGNWIWLSAAVVSYIDDPVPGFILHECRIANAEPPNHGDEDNWEEVKARRRAECVSQTVRITSLLTQAVMTLQEKEAERDENGSTLSDQSANQVIPGLADDAAALKALLSGMAEDVAIGMEPLQQLMEAAARGGALPQDFARSSGSINDDTAGGSVPGGPGSKKRKSDPLAALDFVKTGPTIDLSKIVLSPAEIKMIVLVMTGRLSIEDMVALVMQAMNTVDYDLGAALSGFVTEREAAAAAEQQPEKPAHMQPMGNVGSAERIRRERGRRQSFSRETMGNIMGQITHSHPQFGGTGSGGKGRFHSRSESMPASQLMAVGGSFRGHVRQQSLQVQVGDSSSMFGQQPVQSPLHKQLSPSRATVNPPALSVLNLSFTTIGSVGIEMMSEIMYTDTPSLRTLDASFCGIKEPGLISLCRALRKRKKSGLPSLQGLMLTGNFISYRAAKELGLALSPAQEVRGRKGRRGNGGRRGGDRGGYDEDDEFEDDDWDDEGDEDILFGGGGGRRSANRRKNKEDKAGHGDATSSKSGNDSQSVSSDHEKGLQLLHLGCTSIAPEALHQLLLGLGQNCPIRELSIPSNNIGTAGASLLVAFLEGRGIPKFKRGQTVMPNLDRIDMSSNNLGNDGTARLTRAISKRVKVNIVDLRLSTNNIGAGGIETMLNKLLQHNLVGLSLDNNTIGDRGCQLVAASLPSMHHLSRLNLSFNQIGSRGVTTLMRALIGCESITSLGLSGNVMKISGAIAMGFALAQHPRLSELELDNCCLSQVAQCHIVAGIISNRWVPMKHLNGFRVGPPMVAIGAMEVLAQHLSNAECFRIRRDMQMKTILQWMESNRAAKMAAAGAGGGNGAGQSGGGQGTAGGNDNFLTADFVSSLNDVNGAPSQSAYLRMLDWLSRIPFDEDELNDLRRYFYDADGGEGSDGLRGSDGNINLKHRGDLLAALGSDFADEMRDTPQPGDDAFEGGVGHWVGLSVDAEDGEHAGEEDWTVPDVWNSMKNLQHASERRRSHRIGDERRDIDVGGTQRVSDFTSATQLDPGTRKRRKQVGANDLLDHQESKDASYEHPHPKADVMPGQLSSLRSMDGRSSVSTLSKQSMMSRSGSENSHGSKGKSGSSSNALKARITMFPQFAAKLDMLKASAQEMMDNEEDPVQQDIIAQQFAEASLTLLRQLRYHCMNSGLDGWRQGKIRRKVLIVDDSMVTRKMVSRAFEKANFIVDTAENGMEGVAKLKESIYDIAFMDIDMPVMNGFDATKALREWEDAKRPGARQPICALTAAYVDDFEREELMKFKEAGLDVMESKPCNIPRLFKVVDDVSPMFSDLSISVQQTASSY